MSTIEFSSLYASQTSVLEQFARQLTQNREDAEDLCQETALRAYKYRKLFREHSNFKGWLMTIMRNVFINNYRKKKRRPQIVEDTDTQFLLHSNSPQQGNSGESSIFMQDMQNEISKLDEGLRFPFVRVSEGFKYEEIAKEMALPVGTVKSRVFFARKQLKEAFKVRFGTTSIGDLAG